MSSCLLYSRQTPSLLSDHVVRMTSIGMVKVLHGKAANCMHVLVSFVCVICLCGLCKITMKCCYAVVADCHRIVYVALFVTQTWKSRIPSMRRRMLLVQILEYVNIRSESICQSKMRKL